MLIRACFEIRFSSASRLLNQAIKVSYGIEIKRIAFRGLELFRRVIV